jgi:hypothetical protein
VSLRVFYSNKHSTANTMQKSRTQNKEEGRVSCWG